MEVGSGGVCPSTSCWKEPFGLVSNKHCPLGNICVYNSIYKGCYYRRYREPGGCYYKEVQIVLEVTDVDLQISGSLHAVATAYELCAGNNPTGITWEHDQLHSHL